jgi:hypothetical protein
MARECTAPVDARELRFVDGDVAFVQADQRWSCSACGITLTRRLVSRWTMQIESGRSSMNESYLPSGLTCRFEMLQNLPPR